MLHCWTVLLAFSKVLTSLNTTSIPLAGKQRKPRFETADARWHKFWRKVKPARPPVPNFAARIFHLLHLSAGAVPTGLAVSNILFPSHLATVSSVGLQKVRGVIQSTCAAVL